MKTFLLILLVIALGIGYYMYQKGGPAPTTSAPSEPPGKAKLRQLAESQGVRLSQFLDEGGGNYTISIESSTDKKTAGEDFIAKAIEQRLIQPDPQQIKKGVNADAVRGSVNWWQYHLVIITP